jgi:class 3 adenylate cyclase/tetratricopeptide (TPR) repeat protein
MELLADRDPEEARKLLDPVLERMMEAVHQYEGTVNQVMGDGIMALFGAPLAHEDHAVRACYAALRMQENIKRYADGVFRTEGVPIRIRVGLNSGEVVVRSIGSDLHMDYTAVGQTTHLAARMEQIADPGTIKLTADTLHLAEGFLQVQPLGPTPVKGLAAPVEVYKLVGASPVRSRLQIMAGRGLTKFVGRNRELGTLFAALEQAREGRGQIVAVVGEPGVGKSRLVWEFTHSHRTAGCTVLEAPSVSYGRSTTYFAVIDLLKRYTGVDPRDEAQKIREKVTGKLLSLDRGLEPSLAPILWLLGAPVENTEWERLDPVLRKQRLHEAIRWLLLRESREQPLIVVFEDLHWMDAETQTLLDGVVEGLPAARVYLLVNYRPEYRHGWGSKTYYTQVRLDALPPTSVTELLEALLGADPSVELLVPMLIARTEGNPFFLEETVKTLVEGGALGGERGSFRLLRTPEALEIPATAQAILSARIDRLRAEDKRLLQMAAVIGKDVSYPLLQASSELDEAELRSGLGRLQEGEFLYEVQIFPELEHTFKHALTHEVVYATLLHGRRRELHAKIVASIERLYPSRLTEYAERLAHHAAGGELWDKAVTYWSRAGAKALEMSANRQAVACFEHGLSALGHLPKGNESAQRELDLRLYLGNALFALGELRTVLSHLGQAERLAHEVNDTQHQLFVQAFMGECLWLMGQHSKSIESASRALKGAEARDVFPSQVAARFVLGHGHHATGNYPEAVGLLRRNVNSLVGDLLYRRLGLAGIASVLSRTWLAWSLGELGELAEGIATAQEACRIADVAAHPFSQASAHLSLGVLYIQLGEDRKAVEVLEHAREICRRWEISLYVPIVVPFLAQAYVRLGSLTKAEGLLNDAVASAVSMGVLCGRAMLVACQGEIWARTDLDKGRAIVNQALVLAREQGERANEAWVLRLLGELHVRLNDIAVATRLYRQALDLSNQLRMRPLVAHSHLDLGKIYQRTGKRQEAEEHLTTATAMYREMDMRFYLEQAEAEMGA